jgi:hypothetical protein
MVRTIGRGPFVVEPLFQQRRWADADRVPVLRDPFETGTELVADRFDGERLEPGFSRRRPHKEHAEIEKAGTIPGPSPRPTYAREGGFPQAPGGAAQSSPWQRRLSTTW